MMTIKKNLENEVDDTWRRKGHVHKGKENYPEVCMACGGIGYFRDEDDEVVACDVCEGTGEVY